MKPQRRIIPLVDAVSQVPASGPTRRELVKWLGAAAALAASGCTRLPAERIASAPRLPELEANNEQLDYASACLRKGYAQGVLIGTQQGRPIKVEGNPDHPASLGGTSVQAQAAVLQLWDPDRSTTVWTRDRDGAATASTWDAFLAAWQAHASTRPAVHVLTSAFTSPTLAAQLATLLSSNPGSRWYRDDDASDLAAAHGARLAFGRPARAVYHFDRADLIVAVGGDPFSDPVAGVRQAADWARSRGVAVAAGRPACRLVALETTPGLFGARADERWALSPPGVAAVLAAVAAAVVPGLAGATNHADDAASRRLTSLLQAHRGRTIVVGGADLSAQSHALVHALNQALDASPAMCHLIDPPDLHAGVLPEPGTLEELVVAARAGQVGTLLVLGANPVYGAPAHLGFGDALSRVGFSMHAGCARDETGAACTWHLPSGHVFEQWSDARAYDGSACLLQPGIAPLYDTRSAHELLALLGGTPSPGLALVRAHWARSWRGDAVDARWQAALRRGVVEDSAFPALAVSVHGVAIDPGPGETSPGALWTLCPPDPHVGDGDHANNGWLQELPRPFSKLTWGNALQLGPRTAQRLGLATGDRVRATAGDRALDLPVWVDGRHAEDAATLVGGHGRRAAGRIGTGVGCDNAALRDAVRVAVPVRVERIAGRHVFALTEVEHDPHGRDLARSVEVGARLPVAENPPSLYPVPPIAPIGPAWGMAIDLDACIGCNACTIACQAENNIAVVGPEEVRAGRAMHWIRVDAWDMADGGTMSQPVPCMHCENAPCELVCPVGATMHDSEGLNVQVYNRCIGTRFCSNNCPYKVRRFNFRQYSDVRTETARLLHNPDVTVRDRGVMEKCSYCVQRISRARRWVQRTGEALPVDAVESACQSACPTRAIHFGDLHDPRSDVARAKASPRHYAMLEELGTRPRTTYLARLVPLPKDST